MFYKCENLEVLIKLTLTRLTVMNFMLLNFTLRKFNTFKVFKNIHEKISLI